MYHECKSISCLLHVINDELLHNSAVALADLSKMLATHPRSPAWWGHLSVLEGRNVSSDIISMHSFGNEHEVENHGFAGHFPSFS